MFYNNLFFNLFEDLQYLDPAVTLFIGPSSYKYPEFNPKLLFILVLSDENN